jgi:hypothetical protein
MKTIDADDEEFVYMYAYNYGGYDFGYSESSRESYLKYVEDPSNESETHFKVPADLYEAWHNANATLSEIEDDFERLVKAQKIVLGD